MKIERSVLNLFNKVYFQCLFSSSSACCCCFSVSTGVMYLKNKIRYRGETLHDDWNL